MEPRQSGRWRAGYVELAGLPWKCLDVVVELATVVLDREGVSDRGVIRDRRTVYRIMGFYHTRHDTMSDVNEFKNNC